MSYRRGNPDANQHPIVKKLLRFGVSYQSLISEGDGCPDALFGFRGRNLLVELKNPTQKPSKRKLRDSQKDWHARWNGQVAKCETFEEVCAVLGLELK